MKLFLLHILINISRRLLLPTIFFCFLKLNKERSFAAPSLGFQSFVCFFRTLIGGKTFPLRLLSNGVRNWEKCKKWKSCMKPWDSSHWLYIGLVGSDGFNFKIFLKATGICSSDCCLWCPPSCHKILWRHAVATSNGLLRTVLRKAPGISDIS